MSRPQVLLSAAILAALTLLSIFLIDGPLASALAPGAKAMRAALNPVMNAIEVVFAFPLSKFAFGAILLAIALVLFAFARWRGIAWGLLFVSLSQLLTRLIAGVLKNVFLRARPYEANAGDFFVDDGSSFPSGHAAHFWGLVFALAIAFPRLRIPAAVLALFVSIARVIVNDHFVGDVVASAAIAAIITWALAPLAKRMRGSEDSRFRGSDAKTS